MNFFLLLSPPSQQKLSPFSGLHPRASAGVSSVITEVSYKQAQKYCSLGKLWLTMEFMMKWEGVLILYLFPPLNLFPAASTKLQLDTSHSMPLSLEFYNINTVVFIYCM